MPQTSEILPLTINDNFDGAKRFLKRFNKDSPSLPKHSIQHPTSIYVPSPAQGDLHDTLRQSRRLRQPLSELDITSQRLTSFAADLPAMDGSTERQSRKKTKQKAPVVSAIYVHAGAGYHSTTNEHLHLEACAKASRAAMAALRAGASAVDAVELAIRTLEDNEITNAGYGSNLTIEGVVEGDATIVDHLGRSGACGAVAQVKNPIHLARSIYDASKRPLSLRRVPPNLLVGQGATDFAYAYGIPVIPYDAIVSKSARERYVRWRYDLDRAEGRNTPSSSGDSHAEDQMNRDYEAQYQAKQRRDHTAALMNGTWNEGQADSPNHSPSPNNRITTAGQHIRQRSASPLTSQLSGSPRNPAAKRPRYGNSPSESPIRTHSLLRTTAASGETQKSLPNVGLSFADSPASSTYSRSGTSDGPASPATVHGHLSFAQEGTAESPGRDYFNHMNVEADTDDEDVDDDDQDMITDTVGAIAIDSYGRIAAGASSGGIGMKHRGRVGPAALIGVGSAVIPIDRNDDEGVAVAAVTSGTGEHMATTMASQKCADRLYHNTRRGVGGKDIPADEDEAMESFIQADFMGHYGVEHSMSTGAIGVMAVKQTNHGYYLYFAHNTDSFALASFSSNEKEPVCTMSRLATSNPVALGAKKTRLD